MLWLRGRRPPQPSTWDKDVDATRRRVERWARGRLTLQRDEELFVDHWSAYKVEFSRRQKVKCGYCERSIAADANGGDIDHYRPKAEVTRLLDDPTTWGEEVAGHNSRDPSHPRSTSPVSRGYWWLAYAWDNYVLACGTCNRKWKGSLFPRQGAPAGDPTRASLAAEVPLLLDPYGDENPVEHLEFDRAGFVRERNHSERGWETIRTCHLGRETLRDARRVVAQRAFPYARRVIRELARQPWRGRQLRRALGDLLRLGSIGREHAGMVRAIWSQLDPYGLSWSQLRKLRKSLCGSP